MSFLILNIPNTNELYYEYSYDNSNRLLNAINSNQGDMSYLVLNTYDKEGNLTTLKRYGDNNVVTDDFNYQYYSGTNKLSKVSGAEDQYSYDLNGNVTRDTINYNFNIQYDHRNLITQFYHTDREAVSRPYTYATRYYYDESGSRVRKLEYFNTQTNPPPVTDWDNPGNGWTLFNNEFYVKGADGKDLATYQGSELEDWYVWANDLAGKIRKDKAYYYYKDHLGSIRAVVNENAQIVAAYDYDAWGYPLEGRTYNADTMKFKYTGKELDKESLYDYFGARYYDSRIANWLSVDPLIEKHYDFSPFNYVLRNPLRLIDPDGNQIVPYFLSGDNSYEGRANVTENLYVQELSTGHIVSLVKGPTESGALSNDVGLLDPVTILSGGIVTLGMKFSTNVSMSISERLVEQTLKNIGKTTGTTLSENILQSSTNYSFPKLIPQLEKQLSEHGSKSIFNSLKSTEKVLAKHLSKLKNLEKTSSVEREIRTFEKQIETIKQFIKEKGLQ